MIKIPEKQIIVNLDEQVRLLEDDGTAYADNDIVQATPAGGFILENFLPLIWCDPSLGDNALVELATNVRIRAQAAVAAVAEKFAYTVTAGSGASKGDVFRLVYNSVDKTPTLFQNVDIEKRYQLSVDCANAGAVIAELVAQINGDPASPVIAYAGFNNVTPVQDDSAKIAFLAKETGINFQLFVGELVSASKVTSLARVANGTTVYHTAEDTNIVTAAGALGINTYDHLKNVDWAKNLDFDRNVEKFPAYGASYKSYYFEFTSKTKDIGGVVVPSLDKQTSRQAVRLWVNTAATTLITAMDLLVGDVNA